MSDESINLPIRTCFMGTELGEIEVVPLFRYRELQCELAEVLKQRDTLAEALHKVRDYQGNFGEDDPKSVAIEALAAVEGGQS